MANDEFRIHLISGNSLHRSQQETGGPKDGRQLLKYAMFYLVVAAILVVTNQTAKNPMAGADQSQSPSNLHIDLSVARKLQPKRLGSNGPGLGTYYVHFRLANRGTVPIFYPVSPNTNRPMGHVVYRIAPGSVWNLLSHPDLPASTPDEVRAANIAWVEMPPGGWADGDYADPGFPPGEHAYQLDLKFAVNGKVSPLLSNPYPATAN